MSPRTPTVAVVDFDEEEVRPPPRDTGKREFLVFRAPSFRLFLVRKLRVGITDMTQTTVIDLRWN